MSGNSSKILINLQLSVEQVTIAGFKLKSLILAQNERWRQA